MLVARMVTTCVVNVINVFVIALLKYNLPITKSHTHTNILYPEKLWCFGSTSGVVVISYCVDTYCDICKLLIMMTYIFPIVLS